MENRFPAHIPILYFIFCAEVIGLVVLLMGRSSIYDYADKRVQNSVDSPVKIIHFDQSEKIMKVMFSRTYSGYTVEKVEFEIGE